MTPTQKLAEILKDTHSTFVVNQRLVDRIVARAQNSDIGLDNPDKGRRSYDLNQYDNPGLQELALLLVSAHHGKYDIVSLFAAALEEMKEAFTKAKP